MRALAFVVLMLCSAAWRPAAAQMLEAPRLARAAAVPVAVSALPSASAVASLSLEAIGPCDRTLFESVLIGAAFGTAVAAVVFIVLSPALALANIGSNRKLSATPYLLGSAAVGGVLGGVSWSRACG